VVSARLAEPAVGETGSTPNSSTPNSSVPSGTAPAGTAPTATAPAGSRSIDEVLAQARSRLSRLDPAQAWQAQLDGAVLVDIRPAAQRAEFGGIPGALIVERNVLEWRFDPRSDARLPMADRYDLPVVVFCQEGYTSSLAAAALQDLGLHDATDLDGGFKAWRLADLPVTDDNRTNL
jgi:rhodanese-related sulfurtransferase